MLKIIAFGGKYFSTNWNRFDFTISLAGLISYFISINSSNLSVVHSATFLRSIKLFRIIKLIN